MNYWHADGGIGDLRRMGDDGSSTGGGGGGDGSGDGGLGLGSEGSGDLEYADALSRRQVRRGGG